MNWECNSCSVRIRILSLDMSFGLSSCSLEHPLSTQQRSHKTQTSHNTYYCEVLTFCDVYVLELLRFETITFSDATLSDINVALCYVLSQYHPRIFPVSLYQRVDRVLGFASREGGQTRLREREWVPIQRGQTLWYSRYNIYVLCGRHTPPHRGRKKSIHFLLMKFIPGCVQRHSLKLNALSPVTQTCFFTARIFKPFKEPRHRFPAWRACTTILFVVLARQAT